MHAFLQKLIPQHVLSRFMGKLGNCENTAYKNWMIQKFIRAYDVNMSEALQSDPSSYKSFNDFFTRHLKPGARDFNKPANALLSPADGSISEYGAIENGRLLQAKGHYYSVDELLGMSNLSSAFEQGSFMTIYLSPKDYHRVHMPYAGVLREMIYVPGKLFSVNESSVKGVPNVFARNERVICLFDTTFGPMAVVMVGAMIVASIHTAWHGQVTPQSCRQLTAWVYRDYPVELDRGEEMGFFQMGSTAIVLFPQNILHFSEQLKVGGSIFLGDEIAQF